MRKIKVAQIGTSRYSHGNNIWNSLKKQNEIFEVVGFAMPENEREKFPERMKDFEGFLEMTVEEILFDSTIDAVTIETEEEYITKYALQVAKAKKHLHMEKPGGCELADFEELIKIVKENNLVFNVGYMYRYNPYIMELMQKICNGELGEIYSVEAQMSCPEPKNLRQWLENFKGGMMFFLGCHLVDLVLQIKGTPNRIIPFNHSLCLDGVKSKDYAMAVFEYDNGVSFVKTSAFEIGGFERRQLVVCGSKGTVELKPLEWYDNELIKTCKKECYSTDWHKRGECIWSDTFDRYDDMLNAFAQYVSGEKQSRYTPDYELNLYKTLLQCCK